MRGWTAFGCGLLFALGLVLSGMTIPAKVIGFLDIVGDWDPSLAFVMGGAILVHLGFHQAFKNRQAPLLDTKFHLPIPTQIDGRLLSGAAIFGVGWGLGGFCPGPGLMSIVTTAPAAIIFVMGTALGILLFNVVSRGFNIEDEESSMSSL